MTDTPEDWVLIEAAKRCGSGWWITDVSTIITRWKTDPALRALCDMIAKHEQPPVDRKLLCAREACAQRDASKAYQYLNGDRDTYSCVEAAVRAIHLYEEGFGK